MVKESKKVWSLSIATLIFCVFFVGNVTTWYYSSSFEGMSSETKEVSESLNVHTMQIKEI